MKSMNGKIQRVQFDALGTMAIVAYFIERKLAEHGISKVIPEAAALAERNRSPPRLRHSAPRSRGPCPEPTCQGLGWTDVGHVSRAAVKRTSREVASHLHNPVIGNSEPNFRKGVESGHSLKPPE